VQSTESGSAIVGTYTLRIGTRGSPLALVQAKAVRDAIAGSAGLATDAVAIVPIRTSGDRIADRPLAEAGGKGLFTKEIDEALLDGRIDIGVHSAKDMATLLPDGIVIVACLERGDARDAFISPRATSLASLPQGAVVGTSSLRRRALVLRTRPDLTVVDLRGNVETRLRKIGEGQADATILAAAGLARLGLADRVAGYLDADEWIPAPGQGTIAVAARADDAATRAMLAGIDDRATSLALSAERAFLDELDGSCRTPIGGIARIDGDRLTFRGMIVKPDGSEAHEVERHGTAGDAEAIGRDAAADLARRGGRGFFTD
jgi:hydroxymethylbilane synthase